MTSPGVLLFEGFELDPGRRLLLGADGTPIDLKPKVFDTLAALAERAGQVVSKDVLMSAVWPGVTVEENNLNQTVSALRKALRDGEGKQIIATVPGRGYQFTARTSAPRRPPSVAVLPFDDVSQEKDQSHLSRGVTDELLARLRRIGGLTVAGGEWLRAAIAADPDPRSLGQRLSVAHLLEGSVRKDGDRLRISARLIGTADGFLVWSEEYDRDLTAIFAVQEEIAAAVADALSVALAVGVQSTAYGGTSSFAAYNHYLRGLTLQSTRPPDRPVYELEKAVGLDPRYARAWAELTFAYGGMLRLSSSDAERAEIIAKMDRASSMAQQCAPQLWTGPIARAWYGIATNDWLAVDAAQRQAMSLGEAPDPAFHRQFSSLSHHFGRFAELRRSYDEARRLDGRRAEADMALLEYHSVHGEFDEAWRAWEAAAAIRAVDAVRDYTALWLALTTGDLKRARALILANRAFLGPWYDEVSDRLESPDGILDLVQPVAADPGAYLRGRHYTCALLAGHYGDQDLAVRCLRHAFLGPGWADHFFIWHPPLREARRTQAFKDFVQDLGFVDLWRKTGNWGDFARARGPDDFECF